MISGEHAIWNAGLFMAQLRHLIRDIPPSGPIIEAFERPFRERVERKQAELAPFFEALIGGLA